jgi:Na+-translocating ferredoxin:NAD+ oxidoreductase RnfG subunit
MWAWASFSKRALRSLLAAWIGVFGLVDASLRAATPEKVFLTVDEALKLAFPGCSIEKDVIYLTDEQKERVEKLSEVAVESKVARPYVAKRDGVVVGTAYVDVHRVRSLKESVMVVVDPKGKIARVELLSFAEPLEYVPRSEWWGQFVGKGLDDELALKRGVRGVTGATLSARAAVEAARRVLALHRVLAEARS